MMRRNYCCRILNLKYYILFTPRTASVTSFCGYPQNPVSQHYTGRKTEAKLRETNWTSKNGGFADRLVTLPRKIMYSLAKTNVFIFITTPITRARKWNLKRKESGVLSSARRKCFSFLLRSSLPFALLLHLVFLSRLLSLSRSLLFFKGLNQFRRTQVTKRI